MPCGIFGANSLTDNNPYSIMCDVDMKLLTAAERFNSLISIWNNKSV